MTKIITITEDGRGWKIEFSGTVLARDINQIKFALLRAFSVEQRKRHVQQLLTPHTPPVTLKESKNG